MPYMLGMCVEFDPDGRAAALGGFASKAGLASGPLAGAFRGLCVDPHCLIRSP